MIKLFDEALRIIFFPVRWANAVTTWIQNVASPDDTLKVSNTCSPKEGSSLKLSVNMQRVLDAVKTYFADFWITPDKLGEALDASCDKETIIREGGRYKVSDEFKNSVAPIQQRFAIRAVTTTSGSTVSLSHWEIFLDATIIRFGRTDYALKIGTGTGEATDMGGGWYKMNGIPSGGVYIVDDSTTTTDGAKDYKVKFASSPVSANLVSHFVATTDFTDGVATVVQAPLPLQGYCGTAGVEHDGTKANEDIMGADSSTNSNTNFTNHGQSLLTNTWERGVTVLKKNTGTGASPVWVNVTDSSGNTQLCGVKIRSFTRMVRIVDIDYFIYRELTFDKNGMLRHVSEEKMAFGAYNDAY